MIGTLFRQVFRGDRLKWIRRLTTALVGLFGLPALWHALEQMGLLKPRTVMWLTFAAAGLTGLVLLMIQWLLAEDGYVQWGPPQ